LKRYPRKRASIKGGSEIEFADELPKTVIVTGSLHGLSGEYTRHTKWEALVKEARALCLHHIKNYLKNHDTRFLRKDDDGRLVKFFEEENNAQRKYWFKGSYRLECIMGPNARVFDKICKIDNMYSPLNIHPITDDLHGAYILSSNKLCIPSGYTLSDPPRHHEFSVTPIHDWLFSWVPILLCKGEDVEQPFTKFWYDDVKELNDSLWYCLKAQDYDGTLEILDSA
jgi:hypothetical protein